MRRPGMGLDGRRFPRPIRPFWSLTTTFADVLLLIRVKYPDQPVTCQHLPLSGFQFRERPLPVVRYLAFYLASRAVRPWVGSVLLQDRDVGAVLPTPSFWPPTRPFSTA